jgi:Ribonucleotide reductase, barrel domain/Ribonucleotide reductase, all-alpha domain
VAERFSALLRNLEFLPNSPTLMNAGTDIGLLAGCFVLPVEDSLSSIFTTLGHAAEIKRTGGGVGYSFSHLRPAGHRVSITAGTASGPNSFLRLYDTAADVVSIGGRRRAATSAGSGRHRVQRRWAARGWEMLSGLAETSPVPFRCRFYSRWSGDLWPWPATSSVR